MKKKCVIIGSGLGGLSCGVMLSRNGHDVKQFICKLLKRTNEQ